MRSLETDPVIHWNFAETWWNGEGFVLRVMAFLAEAPALWLNQNLTGRLRAVFGDNIDASVTSSSWLHDERGDHHKEFGSLSGLEVPLPNPEQLRDVVTQAAAESYVQAREAEAVVEEYRKRITALA